MRVLTVTHYPSNFISDLVLYLAKNGCTVTYLAPPTGLMEIPHDRLTQMGVRYIASTVRGLLTQPGVLQHKYFFSKPNLEMLKFGIRSLMEIFKLGTKADIIHAHFVLPMGFLAGLVGKLLGKPVIITVHSGSIKVDPEVGFYLPTYSYVRLLLKITFCMAARMITVTKDVANILSARGAPNGKIDTVYNGVDTETFDAKKAPEFRERIRGELGLKNAPVIVTTGRLTVRKGVEYMVNAMPKILNKFPNAKLILVGSGPLEEQIKKLVHDLNIEQSVRFFGYVREKPAAYVAAGDVFVRPSLDEGFGISAAEAMAIGTSIVSTREGGLREVVDEKTAIIIPPKNAERIAQGVIQLLKDEKLRASLVRGGMKKVNTVFNWDCAARSYIRVYQGIRKR